MSIYMLNYFLNLYKMHALKIKAENLDLAAGKKNMQSKSEGRALPETPVPGSLINKTRTGLSPIRHGDGGMARESKSHPY